MAPVRIAACWLQVVFLAGIQLDVTRVPPPAKAATSRHSLTRFGPEPRAAAERQPGHIRALRGGQGEQSSELGPGGGLGLGRSVSPVRPEACLGRALRSHVAFCFRVVFVHAMPCRLEGGRHDLRPSCTPSATTVQCNTVDWAAQQGNQLQLDPSLL